MYIQNNQTEIVSHYFDGERNSGLPEKLKFF